MTGPIPPFPVNRCRPRRASARTSLFVALIACTSANAPILSVFGGEPSPRFLDEPAREIEPPGRGPTQTVLARPRPDYDPIGLKAGGFRVYPQAVASIAYDDNIFRQSSGAEGDFIMIGRPRLQLKSDFARHRLDLTAEVAAGHYAEHSSENFTDYRGDIRGHVDILRGLRIEAAITGEHGHEDRSSVEFGADREPVTYDRLAGLAVLAARTGPVRYRFGAGASQRNYHDAPAIGGGTTNHDDRDVTQYDMFLQTSVQMGPGVRFLLSGRGDVRDYATAVDDTGLNRDSAGFAAAAGVEYDGGGIWFARAHAGWRQRRYDDPAADDVAGLTFGGRATANITPLTTMNAWFDRELSDTGVAGASAYWTTAGRFRLDHELLRNLIISASLRGRQDDFRGIDRTDNHLGGGLAVRWLTSRHVWLNVDVSLDRRASDGANRGGGFSQSRVLLRAVFQP